MQLLLPPTYQILHHLQTLLPQHSPDVSGRVYHLMYQRIVPVHIDSGCLYFPLSQQSAPTTTKTQHIIPFDGGCACLAGGLFGQ